MAQLKKKFVSIKKDINKIDVSVRRNEIGIVEKESKNSSVIFFVTNGKSLILLNSDFKVFDPTKTGDDFPEKVCNVCHRLLPTMEFSRNQNGINNRIIRRPSCDDCRKIIDGVNIPSAEKRKWAETKPEYEPFQCPICQKITIPNLTSKVVLDHDHSNGRVRGWICDSCNTGIGRFKDNISLLERAIIFLKTK
jgi:RNase P subunit RPR2